MSGDFCLFSFGRQVIPRWRGRNDHVFFVAVVGVADRDAEFAGRLVRQGEQVRLPTVFLGRKTGPFQFVRFHAAEWADRRYFGQAFFLADVEAEDVDDRNRVGRIVDGLDDEPDILLASEADGGFGAVDDEFCFGFADAEDCGTGVGAGAQQYGFLFQFSRIAVRMDRDDLADKIGFRNFGCWRKDTTETSCW